MRRQGSSVVIYILFGLLITVFIIQGPGTPGGDRCGSSSAADTALVINGNKVRVPSDFRSVYSFFKSRGSDDRGAKTSAAELLIRRELLAAEAERRGLAVKKDMIDKEIMRGYFFIGGQRVDVRDQFFEKIGDDYVFDHKGRFLSFVFNSLNLRSASTFVELQHRELLAAMMAETLRGSVVVSRDEALAEFLHEQNTATYDVVAFSPSAYRGALLVTEDDVAKYLAGHAAQVEAKYKADQSLYKGVKDQIHLRHIFVAKAAAAAAKPGETAPAAPAAGAADAGKAKLEAARADIAAGKRKFEDVAKELSSEAADRAMAGDLGWRTKEFPGLPEPALNAAAKALETGKVSEVIVSARGFHLLLAQDVRKGDLSLDQVKSEIALELAKDEWSKEAARRAAIAALDATQRSALKNLSELYKDPNPAGNDTMDLQRILDDPNMSEDQKRQLLQMMMKNAPKSGALELESANQPAAWAEAQDSAPAGGGASADPAAPAAETPAGAAAPAASGAAAATPAAPAAEVDVMKLPELPIPAIGEVQPPVVRRGQPTPRGERLPELGSSKAAAKAVFDQLAAGELAKSVYEANGDYIIVQLIERKTPKMEDFDKDADQRIRTLRDQRAQTMLEGWLKQGCQAADKAGKIKPNAALFRDVDEKGNPKPGYYKPCMSFR